MKIFADCADLAVMETLRDKVSGFTTNPTIMRRAGVAEYEPWAREVVERFPAHSLNFEVLGDDHGTIRRQALRIASWGENVWVKVPVMLTSGEGTGALVTELAHRGVRVNVTAVMTPEQASRAFACLDGGAPGVVSVFMGRIADTGIEPWRLSVVPWPKPDSVEVLWASSREVLNIRHAEAGGFDIITLGPDLLARFERSFGMDLVEFSRLTVREFVEDATAAGLGFS